MSRLTFLARSVATTRSAHLRGFCLLVCAGLAFSCSQADPLQEVLRLQAQGDYQASIEPLRALLAERGDDPQVQYLYGRALVATQQPSLGEWALRKAAEDPEWLPPAGTQIAASALANGNYETAIEMASRVLEAEPENIDVRVIRAQAYAQSRRFPEEALAETARILELDPANTDAMEMRILALLGLQRYDEASEAIDALGAVIEEQEDTSEWTRGWFCATEAIFAADSGDEDEAEKRWNDCLERFPGHSNVVGSAMTFFDEKGDYARSLEILRAALEAEPHAIDYRRRLAYRVRAAGDPEEAERILLEGTEIAEPKNRPTAWQIVAKHRQDAGDYEASTEAMKKAVEANRELGSVSPQLLFDYADALVLAGDFDGALAVADEMTVAPHQEMIRARVAQERGDHRAALEHYEEAFLLWPDNPWARYLAGISAEATGQFDRAIEYYRYSIRIQPDATDARGRLARLLMAEGKLTEAMAMLRMMADRSPLSLEEEALSAELFAWAGEQESLANSLNKFAQLGSYWLGRALAGAARGAQHRYGPELAAQMLERYGATGLRVQDPEHPEALRMLVELRARTPHLDRIEHPVRSAVESRPEVAALHALLGRWLELSNAPDADARAAYERALELDPDQAEALAGMGRLARDTDPVAALEWFDRAAKADPEEPAYPLAAARLLIGLDRRDEAATRLARMLEAHPHSMPAAVELAQLQLASGQVSDETEALAQRAVRFGGGVEALDLLARVYRERDEPQRATEVEARARALREARAPREAPPA